MSNCFVCCFRFVPVFHRRKDEARRGHPIMPPNFQRLGKGKPVKRIVVTTQPVTRQYAFTIYLQRPLERQRLHPGQFEG